MAKRIYSDQERLERKRARARAYYNAKKNDPEFLERQRINSKRSQLRRSQGILPQPKSQPPKFKITMEELETWVKFRKKFGDPEKYDWKGNL